MTPVDVGDRRAYDAALAELLADLLVAAVRRVEAVNMAPAANTVSMAPATADTSGIVPPTDVAGIAPPTDTSGIAPPTITTGMVPQTDTTDVASPLAGPTVVRKQGARRGK